jgi:hypothetical protein
VAGKRPAGVVAGFDGGELPEVGEERTIAAGAAHQ